MPEITGFGIDLGGLNVKLKEAEDSLIRLKRVGTTTAAAINKAFADASQGGIQQMRQNIDNMFSALSKDGGAQKSVEKIGEAMSGVGAQASKSATGIDALIRSIVNGGATYADLMQKINGTGFRSSSTKNSELVKVESQIEENKKKLAELKAYIDNFGKSDGLSEGARREAAEIKNTIDMLERKRESLMANIRLQERVASFTPKSEIAKGSSQEYVAMYDRAIKEYTQLWEQADKKVAKQKVAEYKATLNEIMALDKSMYSSDKGGKAGTEDARIVEARYKELMQKKLALENELDQLIARNKENAENKLAQQVENIKKRSDARISAESQRRAVQESKQEADEFKRAQNEKVAAYRAVLADMKKLDKDMHYVETRGTPAEKANLAATKAEYDRLNKEKERMETELGGRITRIRNSYERQTQSESAKRVVQDRIFRENEAKRAANEAKRVARETAAEERRIEQEKLREYRSIRSQMLSLDNDMHMLKKRGTTADDAARLDELKRKEQELNRERARLSQELGDKKSKIDREYDNRYLAQIAKRHVREREIASKETRQLKNEVRKEYDALLKEINGLLQKMRNADKAGGKTSTDPKVQSAYAEYERQLNAYDAKRKALESQFHTWVADLQTKNNTKKLDEDVNAIRRRQAEEKAAAEEKARLQRQTYDGAMAQSRSVLSSTSSTEVDQKRAIEDLIAARQKLSEADSNYAKKKEDINKQIEQHKKILMESAMTEEQKAEASQRAADKEERNQKRIAKAKEEAARAAKTPTELLNTDTTNMTLRQLQNHAASIKATMADLRPRSEEWNKLNGALQNTNKQINGIKNEMGLLKNQTKDTANTAAELGRMFSFAFVAQRLFSFSKKVVEMTGEFEQLHVAMTSIVGDLESANRIWDQTIELSKKSPFKAVELVKYTRQLAAYRIETDKLHETTKMLADVSAGLAVDMSRLILAYGQVRAAEYLRGTELRQFTEAGVPMLEELAKHFSEVEGRAYSTAEVFEMISKRQVAFSDVSAVLENMTAEGGPFYKMQEQMANTVKGSISTLKNEVDLMMHDIGKSNSGLIKFVLNTLKFLVKHWEEVSAVITFVISLMVTYQITATAMAIINGTLTAATNALSVAMVKLGTAIKGVWTSLGPVGWLIAGLSAAAIALWSYFSDGEDEAKEKAEELKAELEEIDNQYKEINKSIEKNKIAFEDAFATNNISEMRVQLTRLAEIAKEKYSMVIEVQLDGATEDDIKKMYNDLSKEMYSKQMFAKKFQEKFEEKDPYREDSRLFSKHESLMKLWNDKFSEIQKHVKQLIDFGSETYSSLFYEFNPEEDNPIMYMLEYYEALRKITMELSGKGVYAGGIGVETYNISEIQMYQSFIDAYLKDIKTAMGTSWDFTDANLSAALTGLLERNQIPEEAIDLWRDSMKRVFGLDDDVNVVAKQSLSQWETDFNTYLEGLRKTTLAEIKKNGLNEKEIGDRLRLNGVVVAAIEKDNKKSRPELAKALKEMRDIQKAIIDAVAAGSKAYTEAEAQVAKIQFDQYDAAIKWLEGNQGDGKGKNKLEEANRKRIELLKQMNSQFLNEFKTFGDEAEPEVRDAYVKAFGEVFKNTTIKLPDVDFTSKEGMVKALEALRPHAKKAGKDAVDALETEIAKFKGEIKLEARKDLFQETLDDVNELFDKYELSLEIKKLNIPPDLAKSLFGEEYLTLDELKVKTKQEFVGDVADADKAKQLTDELNKGLADIDWNIVEGILGTDQMKELKKSLEKIDDIEDKAAKERMKTYSKYLVEGMNDRVRLKIEEMRKLKEIEESPEFNPEQKEQIKKQVSKEAREEQDKQEWEAFKGTEMYTMMFDDLEHLGTKALDALQKKLEELKGSLSDLPATEVKEIVQQISKIEDMVIEKTNPFKYMRELKKELKGMKSEDEYQIQLLDATKMQEDAQKYIDAYDTAMSALMSEDEGVFEEMDSETLATWTEMLRLAEEQGKTVKEIYDIKKDDLETGKKQASEADKGLRTHKKAKKTLEQQANAWSEYESKASEAFAVTKELMTTLGADTDGVAMSLVESGESLVMLTFQAIQFGIQMQIAGYQANMALGVIGWILIAVQAIATILAAIFSAKDKALQKEIEGHLDKVEKLKEDYEELEALMEKSWRTEDIAHYNAEMKRTIDMAIEAQRAAIAARKQQKDYRNGKADAIKEVEDMEKEIAELEKQLEDSLAESFSKTTDGILDDVFDAAKEFTDAWYDAFKETGDGLSGLEENFEEMFMNLAKNQAAMQITTAYTEQWEKALKDYINDEDTRLTKEEAAAWAAEVRSSFPELNEALEAFLGTISEGLGGKSGSLSELQKGIQGVTEETAQVLESLLNSMRLYVADTNMHIKDQTDYIKKMWKMMDDSVNGMSAFYVQVKNI
jgi:hypothetical protein